MPLFHLIFSAVLTVALIVKYIAISNLLFHEKKEVILIFFVDIGGNDMSLFFRAILIISLSINYYLLTTQSDHSVIVTQQCLSLKDMVYQLVGEFINLAKNI